MARVVLENLPKVYAEKSGPSVTTIHGISLTVEDGEFMVLVGPSGCGKSTTLRMIAGLEEISGGTITIDGRIVNHVLPSPTARYTTGQSIRLALDLNKAQLFDAETGVRFAGADQIPAVTTVPTR